VIALVEIARRGAELRLWSSREHAVWGLSQLGIRALIGTTFTGFFYDNCLRSVVLTISLQQPEIDALARLVAEPSSNRVTIDLPAQTITTDGEGRVIPFDIDALRKDSLIRGLDAVGSTLQFADDIRGFEESYFRKSSWLA
jgi:3-isopropylmalate/(R)-2-methylmalate dehydratase small subunit